jgi:hypothetical protein
MKYLNLLALVGSLALVFSGCGSNSPNEIEEFVSANNLAGEYWFVGSDNCDSVTESSPTSGAIRFVWQGDRWAYTGIFGIQNTFLITRLTETEIDYTVTGNHSFSDPNRSSNYVIEGQLLKLYNGSACESYIKQN